MTWRLEVVHRTVYSYGRPVLSSYNEARMTPETDAHQTVVSSRFVTDPNVPVRRYTDYWGTRVTEFDLIEPHQSLAVTSSSVVETEEAAAPMAGIEWTGLSDPDVMDRYAELLVPTDYTADDPALTEAAHGFVTSHPKPVDAVLDVSRWINESMSYVQGVTGVRTSAVQAWSARRGVCQDFAHVGLVVLRSMGIPARYVSGYLHADRKEEIGVRVAGESHAWVEVWTGGWWGIDPTNMERIGHRHVAIARGRDYGDVAPVRGVHSGGGASTLEVEVSSTRLR
jgi:transglutaminase-like putative cysteine protease